MASVTLPRPAERVAIITLILVFLCGAVAGALVMSMTRIHATQPLSAGFSMSVAEMKSGLNLTDEQTRQLTSILDDFSRIYDNVMSDGQSRILLILDPDQKKRFEQMLKQHRKAAQ